MGKTEISSRVIGDLVIEELKALARYLQPFRYFGQGIILLKIELVELLLPRRQQRPVVIKQEKIMRLFS